MVQDYKKVYFFEWIIHCGLFLIFVDNSYLNIENLYGSLYNIPDHLLVNKKRDCKKVQVVADSGVTYAQYLLASLYKMGEVGSFGREQMAMKYFEMPAKQGDAKSQIELADMVFGLSCVCLHGKVA